MSFVAPPITGVIGMDEAPTMRAFKNVEKGATQMKGQVEGTMQGMGTDGARGFLKGLSSELGKKSLAAQFTKLALGGGAIAGVSMIEGVVKNFTGDLVNMKNAYVAGEISAGEMTERVLGQIPVLGKAWQIGRDIREVMTGENAELARQNKLLEENTRRIEETTKAVMADAQKRMDAQQDMRATVKENSRQSALLDSPNEKTKSLLDLTFGTQDKIQAWEDRVSAAKAAYDSAVSNFWADRSTNKLTAMNAAQDAYTGIARAAMFAEDSIQKLDAAQRNYIKHGKEISELLERGKGFFLGPPANATAAINEPPIDPFEEYQRKMQLLKPAHWMQLPNPAVIAEESRGGGKVVTSADLPQPFLNAAMNTEKNTKISADALTQLRLRFSSGPTPGGQTINTVTMP
jgi:hypothetical protein